ncbi:vesicle coat protein involved in golgi to plasma membrane transport domain-containing protein [Sarocladium implicatum]|nr:vesicle coat protein involved in golgi to plasma membrane transport domain-containing protein [Sarocladium implicatum]
MPGTLKLTASLQLCLAHYCDIHGPTPLMVTEGLPASCTTCFDEQSISPRDRPQSASNPPSTAYQALSGVSDALRDLSIARSVSVPASEQDTAARRATIARSSMAGSQPSNSVLETPPGSPLQPPKNRDSSFRRTYDETVTKKQGPCDNCAMTLPNLQSSEANPEANPGNIDPATDARGPTLRTRTPAERVFGASYQTSPPNSQSSSDTDGEKEPGGRSRSRKEAQSVSSRTTSRSSTSSNSNRVAYHIHYVDYTSTHEPVLANSFSLIRASCLRTLSFETLPRAPSSASSQPLPQTPNSPPFVTTQSAGSAVSGGPLFFGDAVAGYTTAYIFRIPDVHARGHKRVYAFLALSTHRERLAMKTFAIISAVFRDLAIWIQKLAEEEAQRTAQSPTIAGGDPPALYNSGSMSGRPPTQARSAFGTAAADRGGSSFLTGGSGFTRRMAGAAGASAPKARGLAELVGRPDFFIELHGRFVRLLLEVGVTLGS